METELASEMSSFFKKSDDEQSLKKEDCQLTSVMLCFLLDFLTLEDGSDKLS
jgi:hypothetical protein